METAKATTNTIKVYRLEDSQGRGPYSGETDRLSAMAKTHNSGGEFRHRTPVPEEDGICARVAPEDYFGFESLGALFEWFDGYAQSLHENGFFASVYEVDNEKVKRGKRQLVFVKHEAVLVDRIDLGCHRPSRDDHRDAVGSSMQDARAEAMMVQAALYTKAYTPIQPRWVDDMKKIDKMRSEKAARLAAFYSSSSASAYTRTFSPEPDKTEGTTGRAVSGKIKFPGGGWNILKDAKVPEKFRMRVSELEAELIRKGAIPYTDES